MSRQTSFRGGELSPLLRGHTELTLYDVSCALLRNALVTAESVIVNRPGTQFICEVKNSADTSHRLIPFIFGGGQDYMLLFGPGYIWFFQNGALVMNGGVPLEVVTPYTATDLSTLKSTQSGDQVVLSTANRNLRVLTRVSALSWTIATYLIGTNAVSPTNLRFDTGYPSVIDAQHAGKTWDIVVTAFTSGDNPEESLVSNTLSIDLSHALYPDKPAVYKWDAPVGGPGIAGYFVYRGQPGNPKGYIGLSFTTTFRDDGQIPVYADPPPVGRNPFVGADGSNLFAPQALTYHALRLWLANSLASPSTLWASRIAALHSFDSADPPRDDDAITATLATRKYDEIRSMLSLGDYLYLFGQGAEWLLSGVNGAPPTPANSPARVYSYWGSSWLDPIVVGSTALYVTDQESHVRELILGNPDPSRDLSFLASHLFKTFSLVDWTYARAPFSTIFSVRNDGALLGLSYIQQAQQTAWSHHDTDGAFEHIGTIPGAGEDDVYTLAKRTTNGATKRYMEKFATRQISHSRKCVFLDSSIYFNGTNTGATTVKVTGAGYVAGSTVTLQSSTAIFASGDVNDEIVFQPAEKNGDIRVRVTAFTDSTHVTGLVLVDVPAALQNVVTTDWGWARRQFGGLTHLQGVTTQVYADGVTIDGLVVTAGVITLATPAVHVVIGRHFDTDIGMLDVPEEKGKIKIVPTVYFEVVDTAGGVSGQASGLQAGQSLDQLLDYVFPPEFTPDYRGFLQDPSAPDAPVKIGIGIEVSWNPHGAVYLRQTKPQPFTVVAVTRDVKVSNAEG